MKNFTLDEWITWQCKLHYTNMDFNLSRIKIIAEKLNLYKTESKIFTIAGTNGKGSTVAILESILVENGYKVGAYTSPHLSSFTERIRINKFNVDSKEICQAFEIIEKNRGEITLTFFEFSTLATLVIFKNKNLDIIILEVGLGGRLDAVNIIDPDVSIITNIGFDHTEILGDTLEKIAYEKSGIMRKNKPTIVGFENVQKSIFEYAKSVGSTLNIINNDFFFNVISEEKWFFSNKNGIQIECVHPGIKGIMQINNAATAIQAAYGCEGIQLNENAINKGLKSAKILGRFHVLNTSPKVILDIAHNEQSINVLLSNLKKYYSSYKYHSVFSVLKDKNIDAMLDLLKDVFSSWHISNAENERALNVNILKENKFFLKEKVSVYDNIECAYDGALKTATGKNDIIVVFGSSYTVAPILNKYKYE